MSDVSHQCRITGSNGFRQVFCPVRIFPLIGDITSFDVLPFCPFSRLDGGLGRDSLSNVSSQNSFTFYTRRRFYFLVSNVLRKVKMKKNNDCGINLQENTKCYPIKDVTKKHSNYFSLNISIFILLKGNQKWIKLIFKHHFY